MTLEKIQGRYLRSQQLGVSLVELMISVTLGLIIMTGVLQLYASSSRTASTAQGASRLQENIRYTIAHLGNNIARAGNMGCFSFSAVPAPASLGTGSQVNGVYAIQKYIYNLLATRLEVRVDPANSSSTDPSHTIVVDNNAALAAADDTAWFDFENSFISGDDNDSAADANVLDGTDTLVVKFADSATAIPVDTYLTNSTFSLDNINGLNDGDVVIMGNCQRSAVLRLADVDDSPAPIDNTVSVASTLAHGFALGNANGMSFLYAGESGAHRYYIGGAGCTSAGAGRANCSLFRSINGGGAQELVQGVHGMQVQYGYEGDIVLRDSVAADRRTIDRIQITLNFNAADGANLLSKDVTHVFALRNQL